jgi:nitrite reductase (NO-forming)
MKALQKTTIALMAIAGLFSAQIVLAKTVKVTMTAMEKEVTIDNKGTQYAAWTYDGTIPGKFIRVTQGDTVDFTLINPATNKNSHAIDFHAAQVDVLNEFAPIKPGDTKHFKFVANHPGLFMFNTLPAACTARFWSNQKVVTAKPTQNQTVNMSWWRANISLMPIITLQC